MFRKYNLVSIKQKLIPLSNLCIVLVTSFVLLIFHHGHLTCYKHYRQFYLTQGQRSYCLLNCSLLMHLLQFLVKHFYPLFLHLMEYQIMCDQRIIKCSLFTGIVKTWKFSFINDAVVVDNSLNLYIVLLFFKSCQHT